MLPVTLIHRLAASAPDYMVAAIILLMAAAVTLVSGLLRTRSQLRAIVPGVLFVAAGALSLWPLSTPAVPIWLRGAVWLVAGLALGAAVVQRARVEAETTPASPTAARVYVFAVLVLSGILLLSRLGGYSGALLTWESPVTNAFGEAFTRGDSIAEYTAQRFLWDNGILSAGQTSLFFGAPTYALFNLVGFSTWTLRLAAAVATLLSIVATFLLCRRFFGVLVGAAAAVLIGLDVCVLFYGRYGSSPAGTVLAVVLAVLATWAFIDDRQNAWWLGPLCGVALFLATLQYSPARLVVLLLLGFTCALMLIEWRQLWWQRAVGLLLLLAVAGGAYAFERVHRVDYLFLHARGEQFFQFLQEPEQIKGLFGKDLLDHPVHGNRLTLGDKIELLIRVLQITVPQYVGLIGPALHPPAHGADNDYDPPPLQLYFAPLVLFVTWGFAHSLLRWRSWRHLCVLLWFFGSSAPLLLTNRVDSHRSMLLAIPLTIWAALGVWEAVQVMLAARVPRLLQHAIAATLIVTLVYSDVDILDYAHVPQPLSGEAIVAELQTIRGPVMLGSSWNHREISWSQLALLERMREQPAWRGTLMPEGMLHSLSDDVPSPTEVTLRQVEHEAQEQTILLAPSTHFRKLAAALQRRGLRVAERGTPQYRLLRIDAGADATGIPDDQVEPLPTIFIPPTPTPIPLRTGPQIALTSLQPSQVSFGFEPPNIDAAFGGAPMMMNGIAYPRGIGAHAWCKMTYPVPARVTGFQAIIGLQDGVCPVAAVTFELRDENDRLLFDSGLIDSTTPPRPMYADLRGAHAVTLVVTDGGNGRDCDHANWAMPAFLLGP